MDEIAGGGGGLEDADGGFGDGVVANDVVVAVEEDAGFGGVEDGVAARMVGIAFEANTIENGIGSGLIAGEFGRIPVDEDADLADGDAVIGDGDAIGLDDEDVGCNSGTGGDGGARRPNVIGDRVAGDGTGGAEADLDAVLSGTSGGTYTGDDIAADQDLRAEFIGGDAIFLEVVDGGGVDVDAGNLAAATLNENAGAALTAIEAGGELEIADGGVTDGAGGVLESDAEEIGSALGDAAIGAVDDEAVDGDACGAGDQESDGEGGGIEEASGVWDHGGGHEDGTIVGLDVERFLNNDLLDVDTWADADFVAGRGGVDGGLDGGVGGGGAGDLVDINEELLGGAGRSEECGRKRKSENGEKNGAKFHVNPPIRMRVSH